MDAGLRHQPAAVDNRAGKSGDRLESDRMNRRRDRAAIGDAAVGTGVAEDADLGNRNTVISGPIRGRDRAAVDDPARKRGHVGNIDACPSRRDDAAVGDAAGTGCAERGIADLYAALERRRDLAAVADAPGEGRDQLDLDAVGAGRDPAAVVVDDAAGEERSIVDENAVVERPGGNRAAVGDAARKGRNTGKFDAGCAAPITMPPEPLVPKTVTLLRSIPTYDLIVPLMRTLR